MPYIVGQGRRMFIPQFNLLFGCRGFVDINASINFQYNFKELDFAQALYRPSDSVKDAAQLTATK